MSNWFRAYGYASVYDGLVIGAVPLDSSDVRTISALGVTRVLNLVQDGEYARGARRKIERALARADIDERRLQTPDYGNLDPELLDQATSQINAWLDQGHFVYLHCRAGWQRSAAVAAAVVALRDAVDVDTAVSNIRRLKPSADPLTHQLEDLRRWFQSTSTARG